MLVHGVGLDLGMWDDVAAGLAAGGHRVLRYDLLGHGRTPAPPAEVVLADFTAQLETLLGDLQIDAATVVGFSLGALVARAYAVRYPARVRHLVLLNSVFGRTDAQRAAVQQRYAQACEQGTGVLIEPALRRWFSPTFARAHPDVLARVEQRLRDNDARGFLPAYKLFASARDESAEELAGIDAPTLVITGAEDVGSTPAMSSALASKVPGSRLMILDGARHMLPVEHASWLSETLHAFLSRNGSDPGIEEKQL